MIYAVSRVHTRRQIRFSHVAGAGVPAAVDFRDFGEIAGNLLDNAGKWAVSRVDVRTSLVGNHVCIVIDDDGPGLAPEDRDAVFAPGARLDERAPGSGLGLTVVLELVTLYGGTIKLDQSPTGGLRAKLLLIIA